MTPRESGARGVADDALLAAVRRLAAKTAGGAKAAELAAAITDEVLALLDAHATAVFRFDGDEIVVVGSSTAPGRQVFLRGARFPLEPEMVAAEILRTGRPVRAAEYETDPSDAARRIKALGYDVVIGAPIHVEGGLWGVVYAAADGTHRLPEGTEHDISVFADLCAIAIVNAEHLAQLESQALEQSSFMEVARLVLERADDTDVFATIARGAAAVIDAPSAALFRRSPDNGVLAGRWPQDAGPLTTAEHELLTEVATSGTMLHGGDPDETALATEREVLGRPVWWAAPIEIAGNAWGAVVVAADTGTPLPHDAGRRVTRFAELCGVALANVEARRELVSQLVETERLATLVELSEDFIAIAGLDGMTAYLNAGGRRLVGLDSLEDAQAKSILDYLTDEGKRHFLEVSGPTTRREGSFRGETTLRNFKTGEEIPVSVDAFTIRHPLSSEPIGTAIVQHDLRERKHAEQQLRARAEEVGQLAAARRFLLVEVLRGEERMRRQIADALHDDVLQELYAAKLDLANVGDDAEAAPRALVAVEAATRRLRDAVGDLHPAATSTHDLEARLRSVLEQGGQRAGFGHRLTFGPHTASDVDELVLALLREFVHNAVKHAEATFMVVSLADEDGDVVLEVADDGRGMGRARPAEALRTGHIGLASSRERVEAIGGRFELHSAPGEGVRIRVVLPRGAPRADVLD